ncbi:MAG TPA: hypothetical protein VEZ26_00430, partial [Sphingomonadaceae bacterium]|nr:hypothetical protein [Sphingomonadaceae bacterium]
ETTLDRMKAWAREGRRLGSHATHRIAGFKIYPPMGFRPDSNSAMQLPQCSDPRDCRAATEVRNWWTGEGHGWDLSELGTELDRSLDLFFRFCAQEDIPIMSHSRPSNGSMAGADWKALPHYWLNRARMVREYGLHPLRACLGHFDGRPENAQVLIDGLRMNKAQTGGKPHARLYFDVSFDDDILDGRPSNLLDSLASSCREAEDNGDYIMFGSDWIMLGQRSEAADYLRTFRDAASMHPFWHDKVDKLFRRNFIDFMNLPG